MRYFRAYQYPFENPKWITNLLLAGVCMLIPAVGPIVLMGWLYEVIEAIHRRGEKAYPDFDFGKFVPYLTRGIWPFLVSLVLGLILLPVVFVFIGLVFYLSAQGGGKLDMGVMLALQFGFYAVILLLSVILSLITTPMLLRAGLMQEFKAAFSLSFALDFLKKMWLETILVQLFLMVTAIFVSMAGFMLCCFGVYPAQALIMMAQAHLTEQLYQKYLERGGMAIPLKQSTPPDAEPEERWDEAMPPPG